MEGGNGGAGGMNSVVSEIVVLAQDMRQAIVNHYGDTMPQFLRDFIDGKMKEMGSVSV